ncbi:DUF6338 family protein [Microbacterium flavum]|uniref:Cytochrome c biogenesis protein ResB n=1 Tax=Microbacterium flavum TaxID=415216 RepID=A0ABS5XV70_9MICO|nr:DUF6338 family protein [Microbacterium flavum]MBT8798428.1 hypothetical protein [Microbacterium flavum]
MPTDLVGVGFYLLLIIPGVVFAFSRERHRPKVKRSAFRETATAILVSAAIISLFALVLAVGSVFNTSWHNQVAEFLADPSAYAREHYELFVICGFMVLTFVSLLAWWLGSERVHNLTIGRSGDDPDRESWGYVFTRQPAALNFAGVQLKDGTWVQGYVDTYGNVGEEGTPKALTLIGSLSVRPPGGALQDFDGEVIVVKDEEILYLSVTYIAGRGEQDSEEIIEPKRHLRSRLALVVLAAASGLILGLVLGDAA